MTRWAVWAGIFLAVAIFWSQFAPPALGGRTTILVVQGTSMLPKFHAGDLVVVRQAAHYPVGTLAAYDYVPFHAVFFHQIVGRDGNRYVFKGINNHYADAFEPTYHEIIGRLWFTVPHAGLWLAFWRQPVHAALLVAGLTAVIVWSSPRRRRKLGGRRQEGATGTRPNLTAAAVGSGLLAVVAVGATALTLWSYAQPIQSSVSEPTPYRQTGTFSYGAAVPASIVYPTGTVLAGEPVYVPPVQNLAISFRYHLAVANPGRALGGTAALDAELVNTSGWRDAWTVVPPVHFQGSTVTLTGQIDARRLFAEVAQVEKLTQDRVDTYRLELVPAVSASAASGGRLVAVKYATPVHFVVQPAWLALDVPTTATAASYLNHTVAGDIPRMVTVPSTFSLFGRSVPVTSARMAGPALALAALAAIGGLVWTERRREDRLGAAARIARQYGGLLVDVETLPFSPAARSIRVGSMAGLVRLAEQCERMILHARQGREHVYLLENVGESYYFTVVDDVPADHMAPQPAVVGSESVAP